MGTRFKDLCINTNRPTVSADFWSAALGLRAEPEDDTLALRGDADEQTVWLTLVPEAKVGKSRVHLDVNVLALDQLTGLGATVLDDAHPWTVMAASDGVELCAFVRDAERLAEQGRLYELIVDCADPERVCRWWAEAYGVQAEHDPEQPWWWLGTGRDAPPFGMVFVPVPEPKVGPNWIHWDVVGQTAELVDAGPR